MINIFKNTKSNESDVFGNNQSPETSTMKKKRIINIARYHDPEGLTVGKMAFGLWFIKKRLFFIKTIYLFLIIIGLITWLLFFYTFGKYFLFDIKSDKQNLINFVNTGSIDHQIVLRQQPKNLITESVEMFTNQEGIHDFAIKVLNPNLKFYLLLSFAIEYDGGQTRIVDDIVLPGESKYLIITGHNEESKPRNINFVTKNKKWERVADIINNYEIFKNERLGFVYSEKKFTPEKISGLSEKVSLNNLEFKIENKTAFNYWQVPLNIMLWGNSKLLAVKNYTIERFLSEETKTINIVISGSIGSVKEIEIQSGLNIFDINNYMDFESTKEDVRYE